MVGDDDTIKHTDVRAAQRLTKMVVQNHALAMHRSAAHVGWDRVHICVRLQTDRETDRRQMSASATNFWNRSEYCTGSTTEKFWLPTRSPCLAAL